MECGRRKDLGPRYGAFGAVWRGTCGETLGGGAENLILSGETLDLTLQALFLGKDGGIGRGKFV